MVRGSEEETGDGTGEEDGRISEVVSEERGAMAG